MPERPSSFVSCSDKFADNRCVVLNVAAFRASCNEPNSSSCETENLIVNLRSRSSVQILLLFLKQVTDNSFRANSELENELSNPALYLK